jgi:spermidine synthase
MKRGAEFSIRTSGTELMNSRRHGSEEALAQIPCSRMTRQSGIRVLIGGLGMGYTLAAALEKLPSDACITVSELIPAVVKWNRQHLAHLAGTPLNDHRVSVEEGDVAGIIRKSKNEWDAVLLDIDNGPEGLTRETNNCLYGRPGLNTIFAALRSGGFLAVWSSGADDAFAHRLTQCGFQTETVTARACGTGKGGRHTIWIARKP